MTLPWRRRGDGSDGVDDGVSGPVESDDDWDDDWDSDWDETPWGDPGSVGEEEGRSVRERFDVVVAKGREVAGEVPMGAVVALGVLVVLGVVLGPQTGGAITDLVSPVAAGPTESGPVTGTPEDPGGPAGVDRSDPASAPVDVQRPPGAPELPEGSGLAVLAMARVETVAPFAGGGYDRSAFPHWVDPDGNGCDARQDTLIRDFVGADVNDCVVAAGSGTLLSVWDRTELTDPSEADVDHVVALGWAHASGAAEWPADDPRREQLANDPANLVAVTASSNRAKGALGPDRWRPEDPTAACLYANRFLRVVVAYELVLTESEHGALRGILSGCE